MYSITYEKRNEEREPEIPIGAPFVKSLNYIQASEDPDWSFHMHSHEDTLELSYILSGKGSLYCDGRFYELAKGDIVIKNPQIRHAENSDHDDPLEQICIIVDGLEIGDRPCDGFDVMRNYMPVRELPPVLNAGNDAELLHAVFRKMLSETVHVRRPDMAFVNSLLSFSIRVILRRLDSLADEQRKNEHGEAMQEIRSYIDLHFAEDLSLESLADRFHLSLYHLSRQFKRYTGYTINSYILSCRMGEAQRRLIFKDERIDEIAKKCGYENLSYFYSSFRKKVGCTPTEYKKIYKYLAE